MVKHPLAVLLFVLVLMLLATSACKKEKVLHINGTAIPVIDSIPDTLPHLPPYRPEWPMVKTITSSYNNTTTYYYYDSLWRLIRINSDTFTYYPGSIYRNNVYYLQLSNGLATQSNTGSWYSDEHYSYNTYPNQTGYYKGSGSASYVYDNDHNMSYRHTSTEANPFGNIFGDYYYVYNTHMNTIGNYNTGQYYFGKSSVNLVERVNSTTTPSWTNVPSGNFALYNYTYNDSGWVASMEINSTDIHTVPVDSVTVHSDTTYHYVKYDYTYY